MQGASSDVHAYAVWCPEDCKSSFVAHCAADALQQEHQAEGEEDAPLQSIILPILN